ncbi:monocarboxylate transporter 9-like isoform X2 [Agrilus planipennis]|uniref:Monocarboxylate transporter 9-like isoform X2 n=1 Tax=Agrilus planipennis TaxID=224129 RepID=A0A1W4XF59_AGRPL|nr:monocarboxylate transporter 9-like isoform X2 [Agrilus planipennis]
MTSGRIRSAFVVIDGEEEALETIITIPPDGGWGWVVMVSSFFCNMIADGLVFMFGVYLDDISKTLRSDPTSVANINSAMTGVYSFAGPFASALTNRYGFRTAAVVGSLIGCAGYLLTSQTIEIWQCYLTHGALTGVGTGLLYVPSIVVVGFYFEKWRALATSIAVTGSSVGMIVFPVIINFILTDYKWSIHFMVFGALFGLCLIFALVYKPLEPVRIEPTVERRVTFDLSNMPSRYNNASFPTNAAVYNKENMTFIPLKQESSETIYSGTISDSSREFASGFFSRLAFSSRVHQMSRERNISKCAACCRLCCRRKVRMKPVSRPFYRDDAFYTGSLAILPDYKKSQLATQRNVYEKSAIDYHISVTRTATAADLYAKHHACACCPDSCRRVLVTMLDLSILKSIPVLLVVFSGLFTTAGQYIPFTYIVPRSTQVGINDMDAKMLISIMGIANCVGRISSGILSTIPAIDPCCLTAVMLLIAGAATLSCSVSNTFWYQSLTCAIFGFCIVFFCSWSGFIEISDNSGINRIVKIDQCVWIMFGVLGNWLFRRCTFGRIFCRYDWQFRLWFLFCWRGYCSKWNTFNTSQTDR